MIFTFDSWPAPKKEDLFADALAKELVSYFNEAGTFRSVMQQIKIRPSLFAEEVFANALNTGNKMPFLSALDKDTALYKRVSNFRKVTYEEINDGINRIRFVRINEEKVGGKKHDITRIDAEVFRQITRRLKESELGKEAFLEVFTINSDSDSERLNGFYYYDGNSYKPLPHLDPFCKKERDRRMGWG